jgi:phosphoenolpyruvate-protein kinase (PTS system EI component)
MKRYLISTIAVLVVLSVTMSVYAQGQAAGGEGRGGGRGAGMRGGRGTQQIQDAIAAIEAQLANLKKVLATEMPRPEGGFQDMSEEERAKFREQRSKQREQQQAAAAVIEQQVMILKGNQLQEEQQAEIDQLQAVADSATKEKATATAKMVQDIIAKRTKAFEDVVEKLGIRLRRGRGQGGGGFGGGQRQGGQQRRGQQQ